MLKYPAMASLYIKTSVLQLRSFGNSIIRHCIMVLNVSYAYRFCTHIYRTNLSIGWEDVEGYETDGIGAELSGLCWYDRLQNHNWLPRNVSNKWWLWWQGDFVDLGAQSTKSPCHHSHHLFETSRGHLSWEVELVSDWQAQSFQHNVVEKHGCYCSRWS